MRRIGTAIGLLIATLFMAVQPAVAGNGDSVSHWCSYAGFKWTWDAGQLGSQHQYTVPAAHKDHIWTLLVINAGHQNTVFKNPVPGNVYKPANNGDISYVILCKELIPQQTTTTVEDSTTTSTVVASTTSVPDLTTTTSTATVVDVGPPPVSPSTPQLPATGPNDGIYKLYAIGLIVGGFGMALLWLKHTPTKK